MFEELTELIEGGNYSEALYVFQDEFFHIDERTPAEAAKLCVLEATLWEVLFDSAAEYDAIARGLSYNPRDYELFYMLGLYYIDINVNKAFLCMEMAYFYCDDENDKSVIAAAIEDLRANPAMEVRNVSIMILSYNDLEIMRDCIASIEDTVPSGAYEIVVVDNNSNEEGLKDYLRQKKNEAPYTFKLIENPDNFGFSIGCNIGYEACEKDTDVFFLNNDAVLTTNALFFMRMGLYEDRNTGAVGPLSNSASLQEVDPLLMEGIAEGTKEPWHRSLGYRRSLEIFKEYAEKRSIPVRNALEGRFRLTGFAVLVAKRALEVVAPDGKVFDEFFSPAYFEDDDLGIRIARAGFKQYLCLNSFVYHNGGSGFGGGSDEMENGRKRFSDKWGFDVWSYSLPDFDAAAKVLDLAKERKGHLRVIDFTCGFGATASYVKSRCPEVFFAGACVTSFEAGIASLVVDDVVWGELNTCKLPWRPHTFDVVITEKNLVSKGRIGECLTADGIIISDQEI